MVRLWLVLGVVVAVFYIYSIVDCALFERSRVRGLPKPAWVPIVVVFPLIGGILWFLIGRGRASTASAHALAPDDDPEFLRGLERDRAQQERIRRLEQELADLDRSKGIPKPKAAQPKAPQPNPSDTKKNPGDDQTGRRDA
jgi:hypothetical protein